MSSVTLRPPNSGIENRSPSKRSRGTNTARQPPITSWASSLRSRDDSLMRPGISCSRFRFFEKTTQGTLKWHETALLQRGGNAATTNNKSYERFGTTRISVSFQRENQHESSHCPDWCSERPQSSYAAGCAGRSGRYVGMGELAGDSDRANSKSHRRIGRRHTETHQRCYHRAAAAG